MTQQSVLWQPFTSNFIIFKQRCYQYHSCLMATSDNGPNYRRLINIPLIFKLLEILKNTAAYTHWEIHCIIQFRCIFKYCNEWINVILTLWMLIIHKILLIYTKNVIFNLLCFWLILLLVEHLFFYAAFFSSYDYEAKIEFSH